MGCKKRNITNRPCLNPYFVCRPWGPRLYLFVVIGLSVYRCVVGKRWLRVWTSRALIAATKLLNPS